MIRENVSNDIGMIKSKYRPYITIPQVAKIIAINELIKDHLNETVTTLSELVVSLANMKGLKHGNSAKAGHRANNEVVLSHPNLMSKTRICCKTKH